jgi:hypothetical protein
LRYCTTVAVRSAGGGAHELSFEGRAVAALRGCEPVAQGQHDGQDDRHQQAAVNGHGDHYPIWHRDGQVA